MKAVPDGLDMGDLRSATYWGPPKVTAAREQAWSQWKDDYLASVVVAWTEQGATKDEMLQPLAAILTELDSVDGVEWTPLGPALMERAGAQLLGGSDPMQGERRLEFLCALRTAETSSRDERVRAMAYQLGLTNLQASELANRVDSTRVRDTEAAGRTGLYRYYDIDGALLYIGIARKPDDRDTQHRYNSGWYRFQADRTVEFYATREAAATAEREAIAAERPLFNRTHNGSMRPAAIDYLFEALSQSPTVSKREATA